MGKFNDFLNSTMGGNVVGGVLGLALGGYNDERQLAQQQKLTDMQLTANAKMAGINKDNALQLWKDTNYSAQRKELEKAGLNPALIYAQGGPGGTTAGGATGSGVSGGTAASGGGKEILELRQQGMQMQLLKAQKDVLESEARKNNVEADFTAGAKTENTSASTNVLNTSIEKIIAETANINAKTELTKYQSNYQEIQNKIQKEIQEKGLIPEQLELNIDKTNQELKSLKLQNGITADTYNAVVEKTKQGYINSILEGQLISANIKYTKEQTNAIAQNILIGMINANANATNATANTRNAETNAKNQTTNERNADTNELNMRINERRQKIDQDAKQQGIDYKFPEFITNTIFRVIPLIK